MYVCICVNIYLSINVYLSVGLHDSLWVCWVDSTRGVSSVALMSVSGYCFREVKGLLRERHLRGT